MREIKFIHCADLHIDSPFKGLSEIDEDLREIMYKSTYQSFDNIVNLAIQENVDCVLIAGDVYDGADKSLQAQIKFRNGLLKLSEEGIQSFVIHGNHDPLDSWSAALKWPEKVKIFGKKVESVPLILDKELQAYIHGVSFPKRKVTDNLALKFKRQDDDIRAIGLLHTNVGTNTGHESYAQATKQDLFSIKMNYWALGHVHSPSILNENNPTIVYSGNSQSRNPREVGPKGCYLVTMHLNGDCDTKFIATDIVRYKSDIMDITDCSNWDELIHSIKEKCREISAEMENRHSFIRLRIVGKTLLNSELRKGENISEMIEEIRDALRVSDPVIWLEKIELRTIGEYDIGSIKDSNDFLADIISLYEDIMHNGDENWDEINGVFKEIFEDWSGYKYLEKFSHDELLELARQSMDTTFELLLREN